MQGRRGIQEKKDYYVFLGFLSLEFCGRGRYSELIWYRDIGRSVSLDLKISWIKRYWVVWKERMKVRSKVMRKVKGRIIKYEEREEGEQEVGVIEENI